MSQAQLASEASVGLSTVRSFEAGKSVPVLNNLRSIETVFQLRGIEFAEDEKSVTVRLLKGADVL